ncbi:MAG: dethiobiotin synthase [Pseudomonadota bacterium]
MPRIVILGAGTGVGKTHVGCAILRELAGRGRSTLGLKPIESGIPSGLANPTGSDAAALADAATLRTPARSPLYGLSEPVSPHRAARQQGVAIDMDIAKRWVDEAEAAVTTSISSDMATWSLVETAGGVFSPLSMTHANFDLALALEPAIWVLVAADALGVLHDLSATLQAMRARGRVPDHVVLSSARAPDASTGSNAAELEALGIARVSAVLARNDDRGIAHLVELLLRTPSAA